MICMEKKIMFLISNIVGMTLFAQVARLEQTVQLLRAVFVMIVWWWGSTGQQVAAGAALMLTRAVTRRQMSGLH